MLERLKHFLIGHTFTVALQTQIAGTKSQPMIGYYDCPSYRDARMAEVHGFTEILFACPCGASKRRRLLGYGQDVVKAVTDRKQIRELEAIVALDSARPEQSEDGRGNKQ